MGYSCTAAARLVLDEIQAQFRWKNSSNTFQTTKGIFFWEVGREQSDGSITGRIWKCDSDTISKQLPHGSPYLPNQTLLAQRFGGFKITPSGIIHRFPGLPRHWWRELERRADTKYTETYGKVNPQA
jgi:hypothetical protein